MACYGVYAGANEIFRKENLPYLAGAQSRDEYLRSRVSSYELLRVHEPRAKPRGQGIVAGGHKVLLFRPVFHRPCQPGRYQDIDRDDRSGIIAEIKNNGIEYVLFSKEPYFYRAASPGPLTKAICWTNVSTLSLQKAATRCTG